MPKFCVLWSGRIDWRQVPGPSALNAHDWLTARQDLVVRAVMFVVW